MHASCRSREVPTRGSWRTGTAAMLLAALAAMVGIAGCGGGSAGSGGGGGIPSRDALIGTWSGTMDQTKSAGRAVAQLGVTLQFQKSTSANSVRGALIETTKVTVGGVAKDFVSKIGTFTGTITTGTLDLNGILHYDANNKPDPNSTLNLHAVLAVAATRSPGFGPIQGTWSQGANSGSMTVSSMSTNPSVNAAGMWAGGTPTTPNGGFTNPITGLNEAFTLDLTPDPSNTGFTSIVINTQSFGSQPFNASFGGTVGDFVALTGTLPPGTPYGLAGLPYTFSGTVDSTGNRMDGSLQVLTITAKFIAFRQVTSTTGHISTTIN